MDKVRVGIIGFGHMHINNVAQLYGDRPEVEWVACADTEPATPELRKAPYTRAWNQENLMDKLGIPKSYDCYQEMLDKEQFDIIVVTSENAQHANIVEACAAKGVNVCVEKPMAVTLSDALRMARAVRAAGTHMVINWPVTWSPAVRKMKEVLDSGVIGRPLQVKWRAGHTGPLGSGAHHTGVSENAAPMTGPERAATWWHQVDAGGGSILDFCCYGAMLSRWWLGEQAVTAQGLRTNLDSQYGDADDNSVVIAQYPSAMAIFEGSWTTWDGAGIPSGMVYGTRGTALLVRDGAVESVKAYLGGGKVQAFENDPLPTDRDTVAADFIYSLKHGVPAHETIQMDFNLEVMAILDAGVRSSLTHQVEVVQNPANNFNL